MASITVSSTAQVQVPTLTTTFIPAASCTVNIYKILDENHKCVAGTAAAGCNYFQLGVSTSTSDCFPPGWQPTSTAYFSPGICPSGYTTACSSVVTLGSVTETRATCCPQGYACQTGSGWPWYSTDLCEYKVPSTVTFVFTTSVPGQGIVITKGTGGGQAAINAFGVQVRRQSTDLLLTSTALSTGSTVSSTGLPYPIEISSTPSDFATTSAASDSLSIGAKAGIGIGVASGVMLLMVALFVFWRRRTIRRHIPQPPGYMAHELDDQERSQPLATINEMSCDKERAELATLGVYEPRHLSSRGIGPHSAVFEKQKLNGDHQIAELPS